MERITIMSNYYNSGSSKHRQEKVITFSTYHAKYKIIKNKTTAEIKTAVVF
jgi:hypothetical protein